MRSAVSPRDRLLARRTELLHRYREAIALAEEAATERSSEVIDAANDQWDQRVLSSYGDTETRQLSLVEAALRRLAEGTYGNCTRCGLHINKARLAAVPEAALCASCASWVEKKHA
jgi:DnaK suppressor protein